MPDYYFGPDSPVLVNHRVVNIVGGPGDITVIPAVPGKKIRVIAFFLSIGLATILTVKSGSSTNITGPIDIVANSVISLVTPLFGSFDTEVGQALVFNVTGTARRIGGFMKYVLI